ncbi:MAG: threonine-phosphate decarboxylase CobD [Pseudomonadota bacterium]
MSVDLVHGGALDRVAQQFPNAPQPWIDLSTGINPWPWPVDTVDTHCLHHLPTRDEMDRCREAMAQAFRAPANALTLVPGSEVAIRLLPQVIAAKRVAILAPSYGDHRDTWQAAGVELIATDDPLSYVDSADVIVVCNPNNPDGRVFAPDLLREVADKLARRGGWLVVDEAYADLDPSISLASAAGSTGLIVLRSTGKFFGLAGLRLGAVLAPADVNAELDRLLGVWRVSGTALSIGTMVYADTDWQRSTRLRLAAARDRLDTLLTRQGFPVTGGTDLFRYVRTHEANATWRSLCEHGIYTRRFVYSNTQLRLGLPASADAEERLADALQTI